MLYLLLFLVGAVVFLCVWYLKRKFGKFTFVKRCAGKHRFLAFLLSLLPVAAMCAFFIFNITTFLVVLLHFVLGFAICDFLCFVIRKISKRQISFDIRGTAAIVITVVYLCAGWFAAHNIVRTEYTVYTAKPVAGDLRVALIADSHLGITLDGAAFKEQIERIEKEKPDLLVVAGDFVDDDSKKEDMITACGALGGIKTTYGVYFVYGNHDNGYMRYRDFTGEDLLYYLNKNGVTVLRDSTVRLDNGYSITGRLDRSDRSRKTAAGLMKNADGDEYNIMLDHQPNDYDAEAKAGADLVLSGHTHGGHIFPAGLLGLMTGANDKIYGVENRGNTDFVVTSGISGWAIPFKTFAKSEYVIINIRKE